MVFIVSCLDRSGSTLVRWRRDGWESGGVPVPSTIPPATRPSNPAPFASEHPELPVARRRGPEPRRIVWRQPLVEPEPGSEQAEHPLDLLGGLARAAHPLAERPIVEPVA